MMPVGVWYVLELSPQVSQYIAQFVPNSRFRYNLVKSLFFIQIIPKLPFPLFEESFTSVNNILPINNT